ncbi:MAG: VWA domain-containing protein, partial [Candidatus Altiarchaeota archaeon]|nr:VWA domain-containing protein [Candidatus Altiarchaeota archaeon]
MSELVNTTTTLGTAIQGGVSSVAGGITGKLGFMSKFAFKNPLYLLAAIPLIVFFWWYLKKGGKMNQKRVLFFAVRAVVISLICLALAEPVWVETSRTIEDMPPITVMVDASGSMILFNETEPLGHEVYGRVKSLAGNITSKSDKISLEYFSEGNRTAIGDALYYSMLKSEDEGGIIVLLTDGNNNYGRNPLDVARALSEANSTVYAIRPGKAGRDVYIKDVIGDKKIPSNSEYQLIITIGNTGFLEVTYDINVYVDNVKQFGKRFTQNEMEKSIELQLNFQETGVHEIRVELSTVGEDSINSNNVYYKTVEVVEKPRILVVTNSSTNPLMSVLKRLYSVDEVRNPPEDYSRYTAVVLDDIPASQLDRNTVNKLKQYVLRGNGLAVVGGKHSYEYGGYNSSFIENILPVMSTDKPKERRKEIAVAFVIDRSGSQQERVVGAKDSSIDIAKAITLKLMRKLAENDSVGVMAFDTLPHEVSPMSPIGPKRADLEDRVLRLQAAAKDGTEPTTSLELARNWLKQYTGDKYVIFLSDGQYSRSTLPKIIAQAEAMKQENIKVYVVGVGSVVM